MLHRVYLFVSHLVQVLIHSVQQTAREVGVTRSFVGEDREQFGGEEEDERDEAEFDDSVGFQDVGQVVIECLSLPLHYHEVHYLVPQPVERNAQDQQLLAKDADQIVEPNGLLAHSQQHILRNTIEYDTGEYLDQNEGLEAG